MAASVSDALVQTVRRQWPALMLLLRQCPGVQRASVRDLQTTHGYVL
jgi:hypothetical protein